MRLKQFEDIHSRKKGSPSKVTRLQLTNDARNHNGTPKGYTTSYVDIHLHETGSMHRLGKYRSSSKLSFSCSPFELKFDLWKQQSRPSLNIARYPDRVQSIHHRANGGAGYTRTLRCTLHYDTQVDMARFIAVCQSHVTSGKSCSVPVLAAVADSL